MSWPWYLLCVLLKKSAIDRAGIAVVRDLKAPVEENGTGRWSVLFEFMRRARIPSCCGRDVCWSRC